MDKVTWNDGDDSPIKDINFFTDKFLENDECKYDLPILKGGQTTICVEGIVDDSVFENLRRLDRSSDWKFNFILEVRWKEFRPNRQFVKHLPDWIVGHGRHEYAIHMIDRKIVSVYRDNKKCGRILKWLLIKYPFRMIVFNLDTGEVVE